MDSAGAAPSEYAAVESPQPVPRADFKPWRQYAVHAAIWLLIAATFVVAFGSGWKIRRSIFDIFQPIRFLDDDTRGCYWGLVASGPEGFLNQYDKMEPQLPERLDQRWIPWLDYAPLRLLVMRHWGFYQRRYFPPDPDQSLLSAYRTSYEFMAPPLRFNGEMEVFASVCAFFLTRHWVLRSRGGKPRYPFDGVWQGAAAAVILWLSPDIMISSHAWVTWDTWIVPWFLCAALLASLDWWFAAGLALGIGAMFKGQQLFVAPVFILWPLLQGKFGAILRLIVGVVFAIAVIGSGWCLTYIPPDKLAAAHEIQDTLAVSQYPPDLFAIQRKPDAPAIMWIAEMALVVAAVPSLLNTLSPAVSSSQPTKLKTLLYSRQTWIITATIVIFAAAFWPFLLNGNRQLWWLGLIGGGALASSAMLMRPRNRPFVVAATIGAGLLLCIPLFHGGDGWLKSTFGYALDHWPYMTVGPASNIPAVFEDRFGWPHEAKEIAFTIPAIQRHWRPFFVEHQWWPAVDRDISAKTLFDSIFVFLLLLSGIAMGLQARRNDRRMLLALATPWLLFFLIPVQIHERYLVFASGAAACCIGADVGGVLLWLFLSLCSSIMLLDVLFRNRPAGADEFGQNLANVAPRLFSPESGQTISQYVAGTHPDMAWGLAVIALIFLYLSLTPSPRARR